MRPVKDDDPARDEISLRHDADKKGERKQLSIKPRQQTLVLVGLWFSIIASRGFSLSIGVLYGDILETFDSSRKEVGLIQSFSIACTFGLGTLSGLAIKWYGLRTSMTLGGLFGFLGFFASWFAPSVSYLTVFAGVLNGIGNSLVFFSTNTLVVLTFSERRSNIVLGSVQATAGVGGITFPLLLKTLKDIYGWRGSLLLSSCFYLNIIPVSWVIMSRLGNHIPFRKKTKDDYKRIEGTKDKSMAWSKLLNPLFISFAISSFLCNGVYNNVSVVLTDFAKSKGFSYDNAVFLLLVYNTSLTVSSLICGIVRQFLSVHSVVIFCTYAGILGASVLGLGQASSWAALLFLTCMAAVGGGGMMTTTLVACLEILGKDVFPIGLGLQGTLTGVVTPMIAFFIGWMYDTYSSYNPPFLVFGIVAIIGGVLTLVTLSVLKCRA